MKFVRYKEVFPCYIYKVWIYRSSFMAICSRIKFYYVSLRTLSWLPTQCVAPGVAHFRLPMRHSKSDWSICPPDVLARCFESQQTCRDNTAAACVCTSWRDSFRDYTHQIILDFRALKQRQSHSKRLLTSGQHTVEAIPAWQQQYLCGEPTLRQHDPKQRLDPWTHSAEVDRWISNSCLP